jgi:hypothetical protein
VVGIAAMYYRTRPVSEPWAFFAMLIGIIASFLTVMNGLQQVAYARYLGAIYPAAKDFALAAYSMPAPLNSLNAVTQGLTAPWFLIVGILMLRTDLPKLLGYLAFVAFADLTVGFIAAILGIDAVATLAAVIAGGVGGPVFWVWLGAILARETDTPPIKMTAAAGA